MSTSPEADWKPPKLFDGYRVLWTISRTEYSSLCMGQDSVLDRPVTIRFLDLADRDTLLRERFLAEARSIARVQHPNVVTVHRVGAIDGRPYIISDFVLHTRAVERRLPFGSTRKCEGRCRLSRMQEHVPSAGRNSNKSTRYRTLQSFRIEQLTKSDHRVCT